MSFTPVEIILIALIAIVATLTAALFESFKKIEQVNNRITDLKMEMRLSILESEARSLDAIAGVDKRHTKGPE